MLRCTIFLYQCYRLSQCFKDAKDIWKKWANKKALLIRTPPTKRPTKSIKITKPPIPATATLSVDDYCGTPENQLTGDALVDALENAWAYLSNLDARIGSVFAAPVENYCRIRELIVTGDGRYCTKLLVNYILPNGSWYHAVETL